MYLVNVRQHRTQKNVQNRTTTTFNSVLLKTGYKTMRPKQSLLASTIGYALREEKTQQAAHDKPPPRKDSVASNNKQCILNVYRGHR